MEILIKRLEQEAKLPVYSREAGPGIDLYAFEAATLAPGERRVIRTGIAMAMPVGYIGLIWNKNSMSAGDPIKVTTAMVDSGFREEITVQITNNGQEEMNINPGDTIAQMLVQQAHHANLIEAEDLSSS